MLFKLYDPLGKIFFFIFFMKTWDIIILYYLQLCTIMYSCSVFILIATCEPACQNGGICVAPNYCQCIGEFVGHYCEDPDSGKLNQLYPSRVHFLTNEING